MTSISFDNHGGDLDSAYALKGRNTSSKTDKKHTHFDPALSLNAVDATSFPLTVNDTPTRGTFLPSKTGPKPNGGKSSKKPISVLNSLPEHKSRINELAFVKSMSRDTRESAPSPEPTPPLGTRKRGARPVRTTAATSRASTALNKTTTHAVGSKIDTKQGAEDVPAKFTRSKGEVDVVRLPATNKAKTTKALPKVKSAPKVVNSMVAKTNVSKPKAPKVNPKATPPEEPTDTQPIAVVPSNSKPKKRLVH